MFKELEEEQKDEETSDIEKLKDTKVGGKEVVITSFKREKKKEGDKEDSCICYDYVPELRLESKNVPEVKDLEMGDTVKLEMIVSGLKWETTDDGDRVSATLTFKEDDISTKQATE